MEVPSDTIALLQKRFPFFEEELRHEISRISNCLVIESGDEVMKEGNYIQSFPMVLEGCLRVVRNDTEGAELLLYYLNPGEVCSMALTCCLSQQQSNISAIAEQQSLILRIPVSHLDVWMMKFPSWKTFMMYSYRLRFEELLDTIDALAFMNIDQRLERFFTEFFKSSASAVYKGSHHEIALQLNTSREVITRILKKMEQRGMLHLARLSIDFSPMIS